MKEIYPDGTEKEIPIDDGRTLSCLCRFLLNKDSVLDANDVAKALGITEQSFRNKLNRNSFSINDLLIISDLSHASIKIHTSSDTVIELELSDFLKEDAYNRYKEFLKSYDHINSEEIKKFLLSLNEEEIEYLIKQLKKDANKK